MVHVNPQKKGTKRSPTYSIPVKRPAFFRGLRIDPGLDPRRFDWEKKKETKGRQRRQVNR